MSGRLHILVFAVLFTFGSAAVYWGFKFPTDVQEKYSREPAKHQVFEWLDQECRRRFGANFTFRTNECCEANSGMCATM